MTQCCGPEYCAPSLDEFVCQALKLLPDFSGKLNPDGNFIKFICALIESYYECVVQSSCAIANEFSPCTSDIYFDQWIQEYALPFRCPIDVADPALEAELLRLQLCLQVQLQSGAAFNAALLDQIADVLGITYTVDVPTYDIEGVPVCDVVLMPSSGVSQCNPNGCVFQQAFIVNVTCAPSSAHIDIFECYIAQLTPCHVTYCVKDDSPNISALDAECTEFVLADCVGVGIDLLPAECTEIIEAD